MSELEKFKNRIFEDYQIVRRSIKNLSKDALIDNAYRIAHYNEIADVVDCMDESCQPLEDDELKEIMKIKTNLVYKIFNGWMDYRHPERYNFFVFEDFIDIVKDVLIKRGDQK